MGKMSDFEIRANNIWTGIQYTRGRIKDFGYSDDSEQESVSRVLAMFVTYLTACEEARQNSLGRIGSYTRTVLSVLPQNDDPGWDNYIMPKPNSTLKERAESLWGIRVAFTHGDGNIDSITNPANKLYAENASQVLSGVELLNNRLVINESISHEAIRTASQIHDLLS